MNDLIILADSLSQAAASFEDAPFRNDLRKLEEEADKKTSSWSGSNIGYHSCVYYRNFHNPPPGAHFSSEWGIKNVHGMGSIGEWQEYGFEHVKHLIFQKAGKPSLSKANIISEEINDAVILAKDEILSYLTLELKGKIDKHLESLKDKVTKLKVYTPGEIAFTIISRQVRSRDATAIHQGRKLAPHQDILCTLAAIKSPAIAAKELSKIAKQAGSHLERLRKHKSQKDPLRTNVFIGHGRAPAWRDLKDFISERLHLPYDEFNRVPVAGMTNIARLLEMMDAATVALVILTAEDEKADGSIQARMNVIHEVGLFQGKLGFSKAIVLLEEGCEQFSNIEGLGQIRFPKGRISAVFEEVRRVLEREGLIE